MLQASDLFIKALKAPQLQIFIKLEIYDSSMNFIKEITQQVTHDLGQLSIGRDKAIRRSFTLTLDNSTGEFTWGENNLIFLDKRIKLFIGLKTPSGQIEYVPQGIFVLTEPEDNHTLSDGKKVTINAVDKGYLISDKRGKLITQTTIATGTNIATAIKLLVQRSGETMFNFDTVTSVTPYELTYEATSNIYDSISELAKLAKCEIYYDENGYLRLRNIDLNQFQNYSSVWSFKYGDSSERFYAGNSRKLDDSNLSNHIIVLGGSSQTATSKYELIVSDSNPIFNGNPYTVENIGHALYFHNNGDPDALLSTNDDCKFRAKWELMHRLGYTENLQLSLAPHYLLDAGDVIEIYDAENSVNSRYLIDSLTIPLSPSLMSVECRKENLLLTDWNSI
jgi:hypothetical protein